MTFKVEGKNKVKKVDLCSADSVDLGEELLPEKLALGLVRK